MPVEVLAVAVQGRSPVRAAAAEQVQSGPALAVHRVAGATGPASAAERKRHHDVIADLEIGHSVADLLDDTRALVSEHAGEGERDEARRGR